MAQLIDVLRPVLASAIAEALAQRPAKPPAAKPLAATAERAATEIAGRAVEAVRQEPAIRHAANAEPWYRSRVTLGAILSALAPVLGFFGVALGPEHQEAIVALIVAIGGIVGPALTLWGRWAAKTPLGER